MKEMVGTKREDMHKDTICRCAACQNVSRLTDDNACPVGILSPVEVQCLESVISMSSVDS